MNPNPREKSSGKTLEFTYVKVKISDNVRDPKQNLEANKAKKQSSKFQSITEFNISLQTNTEFAKVPVGLLNNQSRATKEVINIRRESVDKGVKRK
jgi:hypothetical protein